MEQQSFITYTSSDGDISFDVELKADAVWLSLDQLSELFNRHKSVISRHIKNIIKEEGWQVDEVVAKNATTAKDGKQYDVTYYHLDIIISVGYRVKSNRGIEFRKWATHILKDHLIQGYSLNTRKLLEIEKVLQDHKTHQTRLNAEVFEALRFLLEQADPNLKLFPKK